MGETAALRDLQITALAEVEVPGLLVGTGMKLLVA
jgi:hypothetical protein